MVNVTPMTPGSRAWQQALLDQQPSYRGPQQMEAPHTVGSPTPLGRPSLWEQAEQKQRQQDEALANLVANNVVVSTEPTQSFKQYWTRIQAAWSARAGEERAKIRAQHDAGEERLRSAYFDHKIDAVAVRQRLMDLHAKQDAQLQAADSLAPAPALQQMRADCAKAMDEAAVQYWNEMEQRVRKEYPLPKEQQP
jgi:hypothetical protein